MKVSVVSVVLAFSVYLFCQVSFSSVPSHVERNPHRKGYSRLWEDIKDELIFNVYTIKGPKEFDYVHAVILKKIESDTKYNLMIIGSVGPKNYVLSTHYDLNLDMESKNNRPLISVSSKGALLIKTNGSSIEGTNNEIQILSYVNGEFKFN